MASVTVSALDVEHREVLSRAIRNVLETDLATETYAQIIDGLPLMHAAQETQSTHWMMRDHPIYQHISLCPGVAEATEKFKSDFDVNTLRFNPRVSFTSLHPPDFQFQMVYENLSNTHQLLSTFQVSPLTSRSFFLRLIELVAVSVHQIAVDLFTHHPKLHDANLPSFTTSASPLNPSKDKGPYCIASVTSWTLPDDYSDPGLRFIPPPPTLLSLGFYQEHQQYPNGIADMVGYWAEDRVLGGVVMFDRRQIWSDKDMHEPNFYMHSHREMVTTRVWQTLDEQFEAMVLFLLSAGRKDASPFPLLPSARNRVRVDGPIATRSGVFRDPWERKELRGHYRPHCVRTELDYPEIGDQRRARERLMLRREELRMHGGQGRAWPDEDEGL